jgi:hypothetical protein
MVTMNTQSSSLTIDRSAFSVVSLSTASKGILKKAAAVVAVRIMNPLEFVVEQGL